MSYVLHMFLCGCHSHDIAERFHHTLRFTFYIYICHKLSPCLVDMVWEHLMYVLYQQYDDTKDIFNQVCGMGEGLQQKLADLIRFSTTWGHKYNSRRLTTNLLSPSLDRSGKQMLLKKWNKTKRNRASRMRSLFDIYNVDFKFICLFSTWFRHSCQFALVNSAI